MPWLRLCRLRGVTTVSESASVLFATGTASAVRPGQTIIERDAKGRVSSRHKVTEVTRNPAGCYGKTHVAIVGGKTLCYESASLVETQ